MATPALLVASLVDKAYELRLAGRCEQALACVERALSMAPYNVDAHAERGATLVRLNRIEKGLASYEAALRIRPFNPPVLNAIGNARLLQARVEEAVEYFRRAIGQGPRYEQAHANLLFAMQFDIRAGAAAIHAQHMEFGRVFDEDRNRDEHANSRDPDKRLRVGYVSGDLIYHPVHFFFEPVLACHDRGQFEITCYSSATCPDEVTARMEAISHRWRVIGEQSVAEQDEMVRQDEIDILVDLSGHSGDVRLSLFARKPAPVQVTWLGYPDTTGLRAVDYRITDSVADPLGLTEAYHSEELVRLPRTFLCYRPPEDVPEIADPPADSAFTFGSFSKPVKWNAEVIRCWSRILQRVPGSRLLLHHGIGSRHVGMSEEVRAKFSAEGIGEDRIDIIGRVSDREHFELYNRVHLMLDTFPYNGTTSTCESLWMGRPLVVMEGNRHAARVGVSLMKSIGFTAFCADSMDGYVDLAVQWSSRPEAIREFRRGLRKRMTESPLMDHSGFTQSLESAYREMWRTWCAGQAGR